MTVEQLISQHPDIIQKQFGDISTLTTDQAWQLLDWACRNVGYPRRMVDDSLIEWAEQILMAVVEVPEKPLPRIHCAMPGCHNWIYDCASDRIQMITPYGVGCICNDCLKELMNATRNKD